MALGAGVWPYRHRPRWPRLAGFRQITFDGRMKIGREYPLPLFSDGLRIYFAEQTQAGHTLMYTGLEGGYAAAFGRTVTRFIFAGHLARWAQVLATQPGAGAVWTATTVRWSLACMA